MFTREICRQINKELHEAAAVIAGKYGVSAEIKGGTFSPNTFVSKMEFFGKGAKEDNEKRTFELAAVAFGLRPEWLGAEVHVYGDTYKIVGLKPKSTKYPVVIEKNGKQYKASAADICRAMA